jgi:hypothetical protein
MEFPRYITQGATTGLPIQPGAVGTVQSQTITLPQIPDLLIIYCKPSVQSAFEGDNYLPLANRAADGVANPLTINFDNFSGLLSSVTTEQLYQMSVHNGLEMDYASWSGTGRSSSASWSTPSLGGSGLSRTQGQIIPLVGGLLVLKPSTDITLQSGQAPSLVGNFTLQFNLQVKNTSAVAQTPSLFVITANSGFFESIRGSSRIIKGVLSEQDIISAPMASMMTRTELDRCVGSGFMDKLMTGIRKAAPSLLSAAKEGYKGFKGEGGAMGCGPSAGGMATGGATGGRRGAKGLSARLL